MKIRNEKTELRAYTLIVDIFSFSIYVFMYVALLLAIFPSLWYYCTLFKSLEDSAIEC